MNNQFRKNLVNLFLALCLLCLVFGCSDSDSDSDSNPPTQRRTNSAPAGLAVSAGKLVIDFEGNEVRASQMYGGKRVLITGSVNSIEVQKDGTITLTFHSPAMGYAMTRCSFDKSQSSQLAEFSGGQEAIVEGTVRGFNDSLKGYVEVENCLVP